MLRAGSASESEICDIRVQQDTRDHTQQTLYPVLKVHHHTTLNSSPRRTDPLSSAHESDACFVRALPYGTAIRTNDSQRSAFGSTIASALSQQAERRVRTARSRLSPKAEGQCSGLSAPQKHNESAVARRTPGDIFSLTRLPSPLFHTTRPAPTALAMSSSGSASSYNHSGSDGYSPPPSTNSAPARSAPRRSRQPRKRGEFCYASLPVPYADDFASL